MASSDVGKFRVVNCSRREKVNITGVHTLEELFSSLRTKGFEGIPEKVGFTEIQWHEDEDGTIVDDDEYFMELPSGTTLMACVRGKETWKPLFKRQTSSKNETDGPQESACLPDEDDESEVSDADHALYGHMIDFLSKKMAEKVSGDTPAMKDEVDGGRGFDVENGMYLLTEADPESLAHHLGITVSAARDFQTVAILSLDEIQMKRDKKLLKRLQEMDANSSAGSAEGQAVNPKTVSSCS